MPFFKRPVLTPEQIERLDRTLAKGRKRYILLIGVLSWGTSTFALSTIWQWYDDYHWHLPPAHKVLLYIALDLPLWAGCGYFFGALMWKQLTETRQMQADRRHRQ